MQLQVISVSNRPPAWVQTGAEVYQQRMNQWPLSFTEIPISSRKSFGNDVTRIKADEASRINKVVSTNAIRVCLDVKGKSFSTEKLADKLSQHAQEGRNVAFIIGGPDGLDTSILQSAAWRWSLSALTFPHPLVKVILAEQLYRAWSVTTNHPYHRGE
jgi:23S rRNA (pseudouridine1915-N3)-methyltransferase